MSHATVWLDHREAKVFRLASIGIDKSTLRAMLHPQRRHPRGEGGAVEHPDDEMRFFQDLSRALAGYQHILVIGPSTAKLEFVSYARTQDPTLEQRIDGVETVDHPTDGQIVAFGKKYFKLHDTSAT
jgi:stalled ribosome rescue protein Dom34